MSLAGDPLVVTALGAASLGDLEALWLELFEHHRATNSAGLAMRSPAESWRRRRAQYEEWLASGATTILVASRPPGPGLAGYAVVRRVPGAATWATGETAGSLETLVVARRERGRGVGSALVGRARELLAAEGVGHLLVEVVETNAEATEFYRRVGFAPFYRILLSGTGPAGATP